MRGMKRYRDMEIKGGRVRGKGLEKNGDSDGRNGWYLSY